MEYGQVVKTGDALLLVLASLVVIALAGAYGAGMSAAGASPTTTAGVLVVTLLVGSYVWWRRAKG